MMKQLRQAIIVVFASWLLLALQMAGAAERGALFKVTGHGHTMHLFGTMHVGVPEYYPLEPRIRTAVTEASALVLEIDPLADPARIAAAMQEHGLQGPQDGQPPARLKPRLDKALRAYAIEPAAVAQLKPWMIATMLVMGEYTRHGMQPGLAVDAHLATLAREHQVPIMELESLTAQFELFNRLSNKEQWQLLGDAVDGMETGRSRADVRSIVDAWAKADRKALDAIALRAQRDKTASGRFMQKVLLEERNGPMADKLEVLLKQLDKVVGAVGVLHLIGKGSVVEKLRARGIAVERIY